MRRLREHIHRSHGTDDKAAGRQIFAVARERRGVAADVDHARYIALADGTEERFVAALADRAISSARYLAANTLFPTS